MKALAATAVAIFILLVAACSKLEYVDRNLGYGGLRKPHIRVRILAADSLVSLGSAGSYQLRVWPASGGREAYHSSSLLHIRAESGLLSVYDAHGNLLEHGLRRATFSPQKASEPLLITGKPFRGVLELYPDQEGTFYVVNVLNIEDYLRGVLPPEIGTRSADEFESLKAQAVAARTYALATKGKYPGKEYDLINDIGDQVYTGIAGENQDANRAIDETRGEAITYRRELIQAYYHSTCAGRTENIEEAWDRDPLPYLRSVTDYDFCRWSKFYDWNELYEVHEFLQQVRTYLEETGGAFESVGTELRELAIVEHTRAGRVKVVRLVSETGVVDLRKDQIRWAFGRSSSPGIMMSTNFVINLEKGPEGDFRRIHVSGYGYGHGVGMCQCGAIGMARFGYDYRDILTHYYTGVRIEKLY